jgi:cytochrome c oxidase subunit 2
MRLQRTRRGLRRRWWIPALATLALLLSACSLESGPDNNQNALRPEGKYSHKIDNLFTPIFWVAVIIGTAVIAATVFMALRFRVRKGHDVRPKQIHGSTPLEIGWTILPAVILLIVAVPTVSTIFSLDEKPKNPVEITVVAKQWWWEFEYPKSDAGKAVVTADEMRIPTGRDVLLTLKACDPSLPGGQVQADGSTGPGCNVLHSFWVPALAGKRDVVPGRENQMKLRADNDGVYLGQCAEYCGLSHANMRFRVISESQSDFDAWLESQREKPAVKLADSGVENLFNAKFACAGCHTSEDSTLSTYGPNLTHLASRGTFASGYYELTRSKLIEWLLDAPSLIPMQSQTCRSAVPGTDQCVGMPSFTNNTPPGKAKMTRDEAERLADYLLSLK